MYIMQLGTFVCYVNEILKGLCMYDMGGCMVARYVMHARTLCTYVMLCMYDMHVCDLCMYAL